MTASHDNCQLSPTRDETTSDVTQRVFFAATSHCSGGGFNGICQNHLICHSDDSLCVCLTLCLSMLSEASGEQVVKSWLAGES